MTSSMDDRVRRMIRAEDLNPTAAAGMEYSTSSSHRFSGGSK